MEDAVNFCFWSDKGKPRWQLTDEVGKLQDGWVALTYCFKRAINKRLPILSAEYLVKSQVSDWRDFFHGENGVKIPLLHERILNLKEVGGTLLKKYNGSFVNVIEKADFDAVKLVELIVEDFPSFRDPFLKRAQIAAYDLFLMFEGKSWGKLKNLNKLTVFADYKLPQILREFKILEYSKNLAEKVDNEKLIKSGSRQEIEIRATTVWVGELLRQKIKGVIASQIDNMLWLLSQKKRMKYPYHRTRTIYY